ncbi:hypothetical protein ACFL2Q_11355 [Thermodesulfobacteriota bacterium]
MVERVAAEHRQGRRLLVAATNLDHREVWVFSLGEIAQTGGPQAVQLYRKVLLAAAAPPTFFPPVGISGSLFADGGPWKTSFWRGYSARSVDIIHVQYSNFLSCRAVSMARSMGAPTVATSHVQPENV